MKARPRPTPYRLALYVVSADEWNKSQVRRDLAENSCPAGLYVVHGETIALVGPDQGVVVVAFFEAWSSVTWACGEVAEQAGAIMNEKLGAEFWRAEGDPDIYNVGAVP